MKGTRPRGRLLGGLAAAVLPVALCASLLAGALVGVWLERTLPGGPQLRGAVRDVAATLSAACALAVLGLPATMRRERGRAAGAAEIDQMAGPAFEERLAALFSAMGYVVQRTGRRGDFGADLVVERRGVRTVVQAKRYGRPVGIEAVQQAIGATRHYDADAAMVVTTAVCTSAARSLATSNGVRLVERVELLSLLAAHPLRRDAPAPRRLVRVVALAVRQLLDGLVLVAYALTLLARLLWWLLRAPVRALR